jgi:hypothetical protein
MGRRSPAARCVSHLEDLAKRREPSGTHPARPARLLADQGAARGLSLDRGAVPSNAVAHVLDQRGPSLQRVDALAWGACTLLREQRDHNRGRSDDYQDQSANREPVPRCDRDFPVEVACAEREVWMSAVRTGGHRPLRAPRTPR